MSTLTVITPEEVNTYDEVESVTVPAAGGEMEILSNHAESFLTLQAGSVVIRLRDKKKITVPVSECIAHIDQDRIVIVS